MMRLGLNFTSPGGNCCTISERQVLLAHAGIVYLWSQCRACFVDVFQFRFSAISVLLLIRTSAIYVPDIVYRQVGSNATYLSIALWNPKRWTLLYLQISSCMYKTWH